MKASAVIGANYGDEGKGLVTDYLVQLHDADIVVRYCGGAQAGHTVITPDGRRHVHHHFGSGTLAGCPTFLSRYFLVNPIVFVDEWRELEALGVTPEVLVDPRAPITTPFDMMLNHAIELQRGAARHGSCGLGINETVKRNEAGYRLTVGELVDPNIMRTLHRIRGEWVPRRMAALGLTERPEHLMNDALLEHWLQDATRFMAATTRMPWGRHWRHAVFEGAQGLRLDTKAPDFPYVTNARTGLTNVNILVGEAGIEDLDVHYVTRCYMTRHGAGPLKHELPGLHPYRDVRDDTNVTGPWQGALRFGWFDVDEFVNYVTTDFGPELLAAGVAPKLVVTCLDQCGIEPVRYVQSGQTRYCAPEKFVRILLHALGCSDGLGFFGPTRDDGVPIGLLARV